MKDKKRIHILLVVRWPVGGIRTFLRYVYSRFEKEKYKITIILPKTTELNATVENLKPIDTNFIVLAENSGPFNFITAITKILLKNQVDIVHSHGLTSCVYTWLPTKLLRFPHLFTSHDVFNEKQFTGFIGYVKQFILSKILEGVTIIHSVSHDAQHNLLTYFPKLEKTQLVVILNGVEVKQFFGTNKIDWRNKLNLPSDTFLIGFFGRFMAQKGFRYLVDAIEILSSKKLKTNPAVLAFGWGGFIREEQEKINQKGLTKFFRFLPFEDSIADAMRGVNIVAMPSLWEACPLLPMETMIAGVPLVGTNCTGLREVLAETVATMIPVGDSEALAKALLLEMDYPTVEQAYLFRKTAEARFNVTNQIVELKKLIEDILQT